MIAAILRRIVTMAATLLVISALVFIIIKLPPGDYLTNQIMELRATGDASSVAKAELLMVRGQTQGLSLKAEDILQSSSLTELATRATTTEGEVEPVSAVNQGQDFELAPMQRLYFHSSLGQKSQDGGDHRFNQSAMFHFKTATKVEEVRAAVETVVGHHPMLRTLFRPEDSTWVQRTLTNIPASYTFEQHEVKSDGEVKEAIYRAQVAIDIEKGPVFSAQFFQTGDNHQMLHLVAHHLVVDLKSWRIIADDLDGLLTDGALVSGCGLSYQDWTEQQLSRVVVVVVNDCEPSVSNNHTVVSLTLPVVPQVRHA